MTFWPDLPSGVHCVYRVNTSMDLVLESEADGQELINEANPMELAEACRELYHHHTILVSVAKSGNLVVTAIKSSEEDWDSYHKLYAKAWDQAREIIAKQMAQEKRDKATALDKHIFGDT